MTAANAAPVHHSEDGPVGAPVLVFSNSLGTTAAMWEPQVAALADRYRIVRYDTRGHGRSPVPPAGADVDLADLGADLLALLDNLGVARAHLCGLSLGGMTAMWVAAHAPERVDRLVLCATSAWLGPPEGWYERAAVVRTQGTKAIAAASLARWFTAGLLAARPDVAAWAEDMLEGIPDEGYAACCGVIARMDLRPALGRITAPTLVIAGADDPATPPDHGRLIAESIPAARFEVLSPAAHLLNIEQADRVTALIAAHLGATEP